MSVSPGSEAAARTTGAAVLGSTAWGAASLTLPQIYVIVMSVAAARFLGPETMGRFSFIAFVSLSLVLMAGHGLNVAVQRFAAESLGSGHAEHVEALVAWGRRVAKLLAAVAAAAMAGAGILGAEPAAAWVLAGGAAALGIVQTIWAAALAATQRWRGGSVMSIVIGAGTAVAFVGVLAAGGGIVAIFVVELVGAAVTLVITAILARQALRSLRVRPVASKALTLRARQWALVATFSSLLNLVVWRRSEFFLLNWFSEDAQIAMYSIAFGGIVVITRFPEAVGLVVAPAFATLFGAGRIDRMRSGYSRTLRLIVLVALPMAVATAVLGPGAVRLVYGAQYTEAGTLLAIMAPTLPLVCLVSVSRALIFGFGRQRVLVGVGIVAAVVNLALAFALIPPLGAVGAALANAVAQLVAASGYVAYARRALGAVVWGPRAMARNLVAAAAAGAAALAVMLPLDAAPGLAAGLATFAAVYGLLLLVLRPVSADDGSWLAEAIGSRMSGRPKAVVRRLVGAASASS